MGEPPVLARDVRSTQFVSWKLISWKFLKLKTYSPPKSDGTFKLVTCALRASIPWEVKHFSTRRKRN